MTLFSVKIPSWSDGCPLTLFNVEADSEEEAGRRVLEWVNSRTMSWQAPHTALPHGTRIWKQERREE